MTTPSLQYLGKERLLAVSCLQQMINYKIGATDPYGNNVISFICIVLTYNGNYGPLVNKVGFLTLLCDNTGFHI